ncbi:MAG: hypothetical protein A3F83_07035 [Candidatus Glassbacteria bacterium RIFCSPLOWO2_12_FULL_58_11]|uniref:BD-FAE-like domain-containing protein n=1 Tax=Candidatus Glassbacteria bacterium RIFCSPLOWO2_12_FULL_58_11 TaxID=1817867 RepID=A0A1F5YSH9_9BACT|nr:MAG: hypothetical protein A3F83_07035 [Candidatus Glassbacteria bacterium RIFCSPLOWO2_12_FULL_58_11]
MKTFLLLLLSSVYSFAAAGPADSVIRKPDIPYSNLDSARTRLDLYLPAAPGISRPGVLLVHGGGWLGGDRSQWAALASFLAKMGFVCASAGYRLSPEHSLEEIVADVRQAMDWFKSHAVEYGMDSRRVGAVGSSAGGHLVALLATIQPGDRLGDNDNRLQFDTRPAAMACYNPVLDFLDEPLIWPHQLLLFHGMPETLSEDYHKFSPARRVTGVEPPFLFLYGDRDILTPEQKSRAMLTRLAAYGTSVEVAFFHRMEHGFGYRLESP